MKFLLIGANFKNKGAQAMLFTATAELKSRFPNCEVLFLSRETPQTAYSFNYIFDQTGWDYAKGGRYAVRAAIRSIYLKLLGQKHIFAKARAFIDKIKDVDAFIDISGYSLSSQRGVDRSVSYLNQIRVAKNYSIPYFIMPQSIGPFDYGTRQKEMDKLLKEFLSYPIIIYPREEEGYKILTEKYALQNVEQSVDLVLQNKRIDVKDVLNNEYNRKIPILDSRDNIAIIPNVRNFEYGIQGDLLEIYCRLIKKLQQKQKTIYLVRHSREDIDVCRSIFDRLDKKKGVFLLEDDFDCIQFNGIVKQMDYIIGSRYHGIVHAYKNAVPAIVLGWATKYHELLNMFDQERFLFDVRGSINIEELLASVDDMETNWKQEKQGISLRIAQYQQKNCFDAVSDYFSKEQ